jgi:hypothetical protein
MILSSGGGSLTTMSTVRMAVVELLETLIFTIPSIAVALAKVAMEA